MNDARTWVVVFWAVILGLLVIGLLAYARGPVHHRGIDVGAFGGRPTSSLSTVV